MPLTDYLQQLATWELRVGPVATHLLCVKMLLSLAYLQQHHVSHGEISGRTILVNHLHEGYADIKLSGFSAAKLVKHLPVQDQRACFQRDCLSLFKVVVRCFNMQACLQRGNLLATEQNLQSEHHSDTEQGWELTLPSLGSKLLDKCVRETCAGSFNRSASALCKELNLQPGSWDLEERSWTTPKFTVLQPEHSLCKWESGNPQG